MGDFVTKFLTCSIMDSMYLPWKYFVSENRDLTGLLTHRQLHVYSKYNGLYVESNPFAQYSLCLNSPLTICKETLLQAFKSRGLVKCFFVLLFLPFTHYNFSLWLFYGALSVLLVVCVDLFKITQINGRIFLSGIRHITVMQKFAFGFFWLSFPFLLIIVYKVFGVTFDSFQTFMNMLLATLFYTLVLYQCRLVVVLILEGRRVCNEDMNGLWILLFLCFSVIGIQTLWFYLENLCVSSEIILQMGAVATLRQKAGHQIERFAGFVKGGKTAETGVMTHNLGTPASENSSTTDVGIDALKWGAATVGAVAVGANLDPENLLIPPIRRLRQKEKEEEEKRAKAEIREAMRDALANHEKKLASAEARAKVLELELIEKEARLQALEAQAKVNTGSRQIPEHLKGETQKVVNYGNVGTPTTASTVDTNTTNIDASSIVEVCNPCKLVKWVAYWIL